MDSKYLIQSAYLNTHISLGIHVVYDVSRTPRNRVVSIEVLCTACRVPTYVPLEMDKTYTVILPSFLYQGGDGYNMLKEKSLSYSRGKYRRLHDSNVVDIHKNHPNINIRSFKTLFHLKRNECNLFPVSEYSQLIVLL